MWNEHRVSHVCEVKVLRFEHAGSLFLKRRGTFKIKCLMESTNLLWVKSQTAASTDRSPTDPSSFSVEHLILFLTFFRSNLKHWRFINGNNFSFSLLTASSPESSAVTTELALIKRSRLLSSTQTSQLKALMKTLARPNSSRRSHPDFQDAAEAQWHQQNLKLREENVPH